MKRRVLSRLALSIVLLMALSSPVVADDPLDDRLDLHHRSKEQASQPGPRSPLITDNFRVLGHEGLGNREPAGDVFFYDHGASVGKFAYVGTWSGECTGSGVRIVDVNRPTHPRRVATAGRPNGSSYEDAVVMRIGNRDVLGVGLQICAEGGLDGLALFDVTNPRRPLQLSFLPTPSGVHELDMVVRPDGKALAVLATPFTEFSDTYFGTDFGGEFRVVDITDPTNPTPVADWGIIADSDLLIQGGNDPVSSSFQGLPGFFAAHYAHSVRTADDGMTAYVSYWDGGILKFDITNPSNPVLLGRTIYPAGSSGDGHSMTPYEVGGTRYILQNDEDFQSLPDVLATSSATGSETFESFQMPYAPSLLTTEGQQVSGAIHDAGDGCQRSDYRGARGKIVLADTVDPFYVDIIDGWAVPCTIDRQMVFAARAGADVFLSNLVSPDDQFVFGGEGAADVARINPSMDIIQVADIDEFADRLRAAGAGVTVTLTAQAPSWGYLRIFEESASSDWQQVGTFTGAPHAFGEYPTPPGSWSIHNTEVLGDRAYSSWYSNGIVALDLSDPTAPTMVGQFVPPSRSQFDNVLGPGPAEVWGVAIDPETGYIYASDMRSGLWIVDPTGPAEPTP